MPDETPRAERWAAQRTTNPRGVVVPGTSGMSAMLAFLAVLMVAAAGAVFAVLGAVFAVLESAARWGVTEVVVSTLIAVMVAAAVVLVAEHRLRGRDGERIVSSNEGERVEGVVVPGTSRYVRSEHVVAVPFPVGTRVEVRRLP